MLNVVWLALIVLSVIIGIANGTTDEVVSAVTISAKAAFELALGLAGIMVLWLGLMKIAEDAGLIRLFAKAIRPLMVRLFPEVPADHPAMGKMIMNMAANMLGLSNAATPFGLKAMDELEKINPHPGTATNAMCTFLVINTSSVQLIPATAIAFLAAAGSSDPTFIIITTLVATTFSTIAAIISVKILEKLPMYQIKQKIDKEQTS